MEGAGAPHSTDADPATTLDALARKLTNLDAKNLDPETLKDALEECLHLERFVLAKRTEILAAFGTARSNDWRNEPRRAAVTRIADAMSPFGADEIAPILDMAPRTAAGELYKSMRTQACLPHILDSLHGGHLSARRYREIVTKTQNLPTDAITDADKQISTWNPGTLFQSFRSRLAHWVDTHDSEQLTDGAAASNATGPWNSPPIPTAPHNYGPTDQPTPYAPCTTNSTRAPTKPPTTPTRKPAAYTSQSRS